MSTSACHSSSSVIRYLSPAQELYGALLVAYTVSRVTKPMPYAISVPQIAFRKLCHTPSQFRTSHNTRVDRQSYDMSVLGA
eukprot:1116817-Rhodomonas_salina.7